MLCNGLTNRKQGQMATQQTLQKIPGAKPSISCTSLQKRVVPASILKTN